MNFYISKIKLWFRNGTQPRTIKFYNDKVNVITGASSTGKSSILKIIDYCLLQDPCNIVEDVINESVSWYGLLFYKDGFPYTIIRKASTIETPEMVTIFREEEYLPDTVPLILESDQRSKVMIKLNELFGTPIKLKMGSNVKLNFRHSLMFNYLTEDIIATENTYQDLRFFHNRDYDRILDDLFKLVIGVDEVKIREMEKKLEDAKKETKNKQKMRAKEEKGLEKYVENRKNAIKELIKLGICDSEEINGAPEEWQAILTSTLNNYKLQFSDARKDKKRKDLEVKIANLRENIGYYDSLEKEYKRYKARLERQTDSLEPIVFIEKHMSDLLDYQETGIVLNKLKAAWTTLKGSYTPTIQLPENFENRRKALLKELKQVKLEFDKLNPMQPQNQSMQWIRSVILLSERIDKELKTVPSITVTDDVLEKLSENETLWQERINKLSVRNDNAIGNLNEHILKYFKCQSGLSESYRDCKPIYSVKEHALMLEREGHDYPIGNVGSKSNYMFLHLCYFFGLHDFLRSNRSNMVLPFIFIDQPSIPYYADRKNVYNTIQGEDEEKLAEAFRLMHKFMETMTKGNSHFQIIMVEHADVHYWQNFDTFETIEQFTNDNGLIPNYAINR